MDFEAWEGYYRQILSEFGFQQEEDERSAKVLAKLLLEKGLASSDDLRILIHKKDVMVVGGASNLNLDFQEDTSTDVVIAADGATSALLARGIVPDIIVTDLDGTIEDQVLANRRRSIVLIHAHGDNIPQITAWTPKFEGKVMGTVQCRPHGILHNFGGFTDGDRGVFLAHHFGANSIQLMGFDFEDVGEKPNCDRKTKLRKLAWAKKLISILGVPVKSQFPK
ncbi:MAG: DUF115 domain-containing protein [Thermoplasmata archaeon]|nr:MAG: DUF115 domain-containing protein [Thermoplasmata archaeon]